MYAIQKLLLILFCVITHLLSGILNFNEKKSCFIVESHVKILYIRKIEWKMFLLSLDYKIWDRNIFLEEKRRPK